MNTYDFRLASAVSSAISEYDLCTAAAVVDRLFRKKTNVVDTRLIFSNSTINESNSAYMSLA